MRKITKTEGSVILLIAAILACLVAMYSQSKRATNDVVLRAFESAETLSNFFELTQEHYTRNVANVPDATFTTTPETTPNALMFPATFGRLYTQSFNALHPDTNFSIYSAYPFPGTPPRNLDPFAMRALDMLMSGDETSLRQLDNLSDGRQQVRLAVPIVMQEGCVDCHNDIAFELARRNWMVGDVRGVREVSITIEPLSLFSQTELFSLLILMSGASLLGIFVVYPAVRKEVQSKQYFHDLSIEAREAAETSLVQAHTDSLTKIGNRRYFDLELNRTLQIGHKPCALMIFDIDHFKVVNDELGHDAGDYAIQTFAGILARSIRAEDKLARFGGEEFVVIVPVLEPYELLAMARRIKDAIQHTNFEHQGRFFNITASVGCTDVQPGDTAETIVKRADKMLYKAKVKGRNKVCWQFGTTSDDTP